MLQASVDIDPDMLHSAEVCFFLILLLKKIPPTLCVFPQVAEAVVVALTRAPVEADSCLKFSTKKKCIYAPNSLLAQMCNMISPRLSKWLAGCLAQLVTNCREESRSQLQQRLRSNKTFLKSKLLKLVEK